jgi:hypothetical protein
MNSPQTKFNETDLTVTAGIVISGISGVIAKTKRGPIANPNIVITSWEQFKQLYGGLTANDSDPTTLMIKRALEQGSALRVSRAVHYNDPSEATNYDAEFSQQGTNAHFALSIDLGAAHTIIYHIGADSVSQAYDTSSLHTLELLAAAIKAAFSQVLDVVVLDSEHFYVVPAGANITDSVTITGASAPVVTRTTNASFQDADANSLFSLIPKYAGADYNNIVAKVLSPSNGQTGYWDLELTYLSGEIPTERYTNLKIVGSPSNPDFLDVVVKRSKMVNVIYTDLSGILVNPIVPVPYTIKFNAGDDGSSVAEADLIGDSAGKTGFYAFDGVDDVAQIAVLGPVDSVFVTKAVHVAGAAYANNRKDLQYFGFIDSTEAHSEFQILNTKADLGVDSSYVMWFAGFIKVIHPLTSAEVSIPSLGDILALAAYTDANFGLWYSFSGRNRGAIQNSLGADNKWGSEGNITNLNYLANFQINVVINRKGKTLLWGSFTGQLNSSQLSFANVRRLHIYLKKALGPLLENFLEEPNDFTTWLTIYLSAKPFMDALIPKRAIFDYRWEGDQFATSLDQLKVNNASDVGLGKYVIRLFVKDIVSLQEISVDIVLTPTGVSFEDALSIVQP